MYAQQTSVPENECATFTPPKEAKAHEDKIASQLAIFTENFLKQGNADKTTAIVVPIQIHIVRRDNGTGGKSYSAIQSEITNYVQTRYASINVSFSEKLSKNDLFRNLPFSTK
jgi:hypothetical protein